VLGVFGGWGRSRRHMEKARMYSWSVLTAIVFRISEIRLKFGTN